ncbi:MAG: hypothetical protein JWM05_3474 [Acidimicrobiales bacterium]|nr:hypothetical protein [Acidimicrobiales bacterium]
MCIGDSITSADAGHPSLTTGIVGWAEQLADIVAMGEEPSGGFRGLWRRDEWTLTGTWTAVLRSEVYDVGPFEQSLFSSGTEIDRLTWTKPAAMTVARFDLYWFAMDGTGDWQYRVDGGRWLRSGAPSSPPDNGLHRIAVEIPIVEQLEIRAFDGSAPCVAPIVGISVDAVSPPERRPVVHKLAHAGDRLICFCRPSEGDPLALLDHLQPDLVTILFSNDVVFRKPDLFDEPLRRLIERVRPSADVLVIAPYEQRTTRTVADAVTTEGSRLLGSPSASFTDVDVWRKLSGTNVAWGTSISSVTSPESVVMSMPATGSAEHGDLNIGSPRAPEVQAAYRAVAKEVAAETGCAFLDLHEAWIDMAGAGWEASYAHGLMADTMHPSQRGHDEIARRVAAKLGLGSD